MKPPMPPSSSKTYPLLPPKFPLAIIFYFIIIIIVVVIIIIRIFNLKSDLLASLSINTVLLLAVDAIVYSRSHFLNWR